MNKEGWTKDWTTVDKFAGMNIAGLDSGH